MFYSKSAMFWLGLCVVLGAEGSIVDLIDPCHINDNTCILASANKFLPHIMKGDPGLNIAPLDPLQMKNVNAGSGELELELFDLIVKNLSNCTLTKVERPEEFKVYIEAECPVSAKGQYKANGKFFEYDIFGQGDFELETGNIKFSVTLNLKTVEGKDGKPHLKIKKFDYKYVPDEKTSMIFKNLYNGDESRAKPILDIMRDNGKDVLNSLGRPVITELLTEVVHCINKVFDAKPKDELELV